MKSQAELKDSWECNNSIQVNIFGVKAKDIYIIKNDGYMR